MNDFKLYVCEENNVRLDAYLSKVLVDQSRTYIKTLIQEEKILVNLKVVKPNYKLKVNDEILVDIPKPKELELEAQDIPLEIVFEDKELIIVNKEKGMVVHPAPGSPDKTLVNALLYKYQGKLSDINGVIRPGIVHRIDKDTSGIMVVAKTNEAHKGLSELFKVHDIKREYIALVHGVISENKGKISAPIGRDENDRKRMAVNLKNGKKAVTYFEVLKRFKRYTLIKATLETGRTHQIRVHMKYIGYPLVGDELYRRRKDKIQGQMLHARYLGFVHPISKEFVEFSSELPEYFKEFLEKIESYE